jgi:hypothetical protein
MDYEQNFVPYESNKLPQISYRVFDNVDIGLKENRKASVFIPSSTLVESFNLILKHQQIIPDLWTPDRKSIDIYFGKRSMADVMSEKVGVGMVGNIYTALEETLFTTPDSFVCLLHNKEFIYINTPQILSRMIGTPEQQIADSKQYLSEIFAHEQTHIAQDISSAGKNQKSKDAAVSAGFSVFGSLSGISFSAYIAKKITNNNIDSLFHKPMTRRQFLKFALYFTGATAYTLFTLKVFNLASYFSLNQSEKQARNSENDQEIITLLKNQFNIEIK